MNEIAAIYRHRFSDRDRAEKDAIWQVLCKAFFQRFVPAEASVLDLACGYGEFSRHIRAANRIAVDENIAAGALLPPEITFHHGPANDLSFLPAAAIDLCFTSNFFEHLPDKPAMDAVLTEVRRVLKPGGRLVALQPNLRFVGQAYWDFYDHHLPLTERSCAEGLVKNGFEIETVISRFLPYTTKSRLPRAPALVRLYLRVPLAWRVLGKQFLIVARKPV